MDNLVILTLLLAVAVTESQTQIVSSSHEYVNEVNHVQVGVCFQKELIILPWCLTFSFNSAVSIHLYLNKLQLEKRRQRSVSLPFICHGSIEHNHQYHISSQQ